MRDALTAARLAVAAMKGEQQQQPALASAEHYSHIAPLYVLQGSLLAAAQAHASTTVRAAADQVAVICAQSHQLQGVVSGLHPTWVPPT